MTDETPGVSDAPSLESIFSDEALGSAYDAAQGEPADTATEAPAEPSAPARDEHGRFVSSKAPELGDDALAPPAEASETEAETDEITDDPEAQQPPAPASTPVGEPPVSWTPEVKAEWSKLPPAVQQAVLKREQEIDNGFKAIEGYKPIQNAIAPRMDALRAEFGSVEQGLNTLFQISDFAARDPDGFVRWFASQRGLNVSNGVQTGEMSDDADSPVMRELQQLRQQVHSITTTAHQREQMDARAAIDAIAKDPINFPYFNDVRVQMANLIRSGMASDTDLKEAYDKAVWLNPDTRQKVQADQSRAAEEKRQKAAAEAATKARKAAGTVVNTTGAPARTKAAPRSIEQTLSEAYDRAQGRG